MCFKYFSDVLIILIVSRSVYKEARKFVFLMCLANFKMHALLFFLLPSQTQ